MPVPSTKTVPKSKAKMATAQKATAKSNNKRKLKKAAQKKVVVVDPKDHTKVTYTPSQIAKLKREAKSEIKEKLVELMKPNALIYTKADFGDIEVAWQEIANSVLAAIQADMPMSSPPLGYSALVAYLWWFMIDRLRLTSSLSNQPDLSVVPTFPDNGVVPVGWAYFVMHLMPYRDPVTHAYYQYRYTYTGVPAVTSTSINQIASTEFGFQALGNSFLNPNPTSPSGTDELTWLNDSISFTFANVTSTYFDRINNFFSSSNDYVESRFVPLMAPDASAFAIPYAHATNGANVRAPGVYCQSNFFDNEMACIIHPPFQGNPATPLSKTDFFGSYVADFSMKPLPQNFIQSPAKVTTNPKLSSIGQLELILNYGFICHNCKFVIGGRKKLLRTAMAWKGLNSFQSDFYPINLMGYHQAIADHLSATFFTPNLAAPAGSAPTNNFIDNADIMTVIAFFESVMVARTMASAYLGTMLWTPDDIVSQTNYGAEFRSVMVPPVIGDLLDTWAPTVKNGRLVVFCNDYRPLTNFGLTVAGTIPTNANFNIARWLQIGTNFGAQNGNINYFNPKDGANFTNWTAQPWSFNFTNGPLGTVPATTVWNLRGAGATQTVASSWLTPISQADQGQNFTSSPPTTGDTLGPAAPCIFANRITQRTLEIYGNLTSTWMAFDYAKLGGYVNQTQLVGDPIYAQEGITTMATQALSSNIFYINATLVIRRLGAYFPLDRESVGRSEVYSPRLSVFNNDRFPAVQSCSANSSLITPLVDSTMLGGLSNFNQSMNAALRDGLTQKEAARSIIGIVQRDNVPAFSSIVYNVPTAISIIRRSKVSMTFAPYHTEQSASLTQYNSPSLWDTFWTTIWDVGKTVVDGVSSGLTGAVVGKYLNMSVNPRSDFAVHPTIKRFAAMHPAPPVVPQITTKDRDKQYKNAVDKANKVALSFVKISDNAPAAPLIDDIVKSVAAEICKRKSSIFSFD